MGDSVPESKGLWLASGLRMHTHTYMHTENYGDSVWGAVWQGASNSTKPLKHHGNSDALLTSSCLGCLPLRRHSQNAEVG